MRKRDIKTGLLVEHKQSGLRGTIVKVKDDLRAPGAPPPVDKIFIIKVHDSTIWVNEREERTRFGNHLQWSVVTKPKPEPVPVKHLELDDLIVGARITNIATKEDGVISKIQGSQGLDGKWTIEAFKFTPDKRGPFWETRYATDDGLKLFCLPIKLPPPLHKVGKVVKFYNKRCFYTGTIERVWENDNTYDISVFFRDIPENDIYQKKD